MAQWLDQTSIMSAEVGLVCDLCERNFTKYKNNSIDRVCQLTLSNHNNILVVWDMFKSLNILEN